VPLPVATGNPPERRVVAPPMTINLISRRVSLRSRWAQTYPTLMGRPTTSWRPIAVGSNRALAPAMIGAQARTTPWVPA
jgi:hypothetical protein